MDVDDFLVEANGAGVREALRIILDLEELKKPTLVLIEEPEAHLHPGLARTIANYLREKSHDIQMFITTQSTEFVDSATFNNVFLVARDSHNRTVCNAVERESGVAVIPAELGLRLSTVFMFDRLVFVESASDENVLRMLSTALHIDLTRQNVVSSTWAASETLRTLPQRELWSYCHAGKLRCGS